MQSVTVTFTNFHSRKRETLRLLKYLVQKWSVKKSPQKLFGMLFTLLYNVMDVHFKKRISTKKRKLNDLSAPKKPCDILDYIYSSKYICRMQTNIDNCHNIKACGTHV